MVHYTFTTNQSAVTTYCYTAGTLIHYSQVQNCVNSSQYGIIMHIRRFIGDAQFGSFLRDCQCLIKFPISSSYTVTGPAHT